MINETEEKGPGEVRTDIARDEEDVRNSRIAVVLLWVGVVCAIFAVIIAGSLVMSELILKFFRSQIHTAASRIGINEIAAVSLLMTCATSLAVMPLFESMDDKGKEVVAALSLRGSFVIGGSLAFVSNVTTGYNVLIFVVTKLVCGIISAWVIHRMWRRK